MATRKGVRGVWRVPEADYEELSSTLPDDSKDLFPSMALALSFVEPYLSYLRPLITLDSRTVVAGVFSLMALAMISRSIHPTDVVGSSSIAPASTGKMLVAVTNKETTHIRGAAAAQGNAVITDSSQPGAGINCKPTGDCDGAFAYVPRLQEKPSTKLAEEVARCVAAYSSKGPEERSRYDEDMIVYNNFFKASSSAIESGFFLELGAYNGMTEANTRLFEECLGWKVRILYGEGCPPW